MILTDIDFSHISVWHSDRRLVPEEKHHPALPVSICFAADHPNERIVNMSRYDFKRVDFFNIWHLFRGMDWSFQLDFNDIEEAGFSFCNCLNDVFSRTIPLKKLLLGDFPSGT
ncbi:hypothetical protein AVEN_270296-1 [Araneus ventricosus]|uniref:Uncharacterized protein n=1 Tax=Araneus ventricosus TaxID=182803 RepID=A0A4Y2NP88_ARAVE|nr:hypothetical protein AVEN_270296-1 [Araneus ventricosus]